MGAGAGVTADPAGRPLETAPNIPIVTNMIAKTVKIVSGSPKMTSAESAEVIGTNAVIIVVSDAPSAPTARVNSSSEMIMLRKP